MRICSFLPSATEILYALGLGDDVAGVTFECDYPPEARRKPVVVDTNLPHAGSPGEIDASVNSFTSHGDSIYRVDIDLLRKIDPELIVTQELCDVCAVSTSYVAKALAGLPSRPQVLSLTPHRLVDVWRDIVLVGEATGNGSHALALIGTLEERVARVRERCRPYPKVRVLCLEWLDPLFNAGHWVPEMVELAGGIEVLGRAGEMSVPITWDQVAAAEPEVIVVMPCGYDLERTVEQFHATPRSPVWNTLRAVRNQRIYAVAGSSHFSRPGPRLATGIEIMAQLLHPEESFAHDCEWVALD